MKSKKVFLAIVLAFVLLIGGAAVLYDKLSEDFAAEQLVVQETEKEAESVESEDETPMAPPFSVYNADGNKVYLSDYVGKPVVLNFWASWCGFCEMEMPDFEEKYLELGDDLHFLMVNVTDGKQETIESASEFIAESGYTFPVYYDKDLDAASAYGAYSLPVTFFIDAEGHAIAKASGAINADTLQQGIDMIKQ